MDPHSSPALAAFMLHACPAVGAVIALAMFASPMKAVLEANRNKALGDLNPLPFVGMCANCTAWLLYGTLTHDFYVYFSNILGLLLAYFYIFTSLKFAPEKAQDRVRNIFLGFVVFFLVIGIVNLAANLDYAGSKLLWGSACVTVLGVYYVAPLSTVATVLRNRDSSSMYWPLSMMNVINGCLWGAYGLAILDWFIAIPNAVGAVFNVACLIMCFVFPNKSAPPKDGLENLGLNGGIASSSRSGGFFSRFSRGSGDSDKKAAAGNKDTDAAGDVEGAITVADGTRAL